MSQAVAAGTPAVLATVVASRRSGQRHAGTKMLVVGDGRLVGNVGGGAMESRVTANGPELSTKKSSASSSGDPAEGAERKGPRARTEVGVPFKRLKSALTSAPVWLCRASRASS